MSNPSNGKSISEIIQNTQFEDLTKLHRYLCNTISKYFKPSAFHYYWKEEDCLRFYWGSDDDYSDFTYMLDVYEDTIELYVRYEAHYCRRFLDFSGDSMNRFNKWASGFSDIYQMQPDIITRSIKRKI